MITILIKDSLALRENNTRMLLGVVISADRQMPRNRRKSKEVPVSRRDAISRSGRAIKRKMPLPDTFAGFPRILPLILHKRAFKRSAIRFARFLLSSTV